MKLFSTGEVAKILNLPNHRIRSFVRAGFVAPARGEKKALRFSFQDLLFLKTAKGLLDKNPSPTVEQVKAVLPDALADVRAWVRKVNHLPE